MKKSFLLTILFIVILATSSLACEICGCSNNNFQIGILPTFSKGFMGFRYTTSRFSSHLKTDASEYSHDYYQTMELWGGYNFKKIQVMAFMPYVFSRKKSDDGTTISNGAGDLLLLVNYKVFSSSSLSKNEKTTFRNDIYLGGGVKLPTGVNRVDTTDPDFNIGDFNSQAGTGSVDYIFNVTHNLMWNRSGVVTNAAYRFNTANKQDYKFGNRAYVNMAYYYTFTTGDTKIKPNVGFNYQSNAINKFEGSEVEDSNGYNFNSTVGVNVLRKKIGVNAMASIPVAQNMYDGQTKLQSRILVGVTYSF
ncbi:MAG TPA: hypothetical protein VIM65_05630 [Cyclobacteriaceae bacterium]